MNILIILVLVVGAVIGYAKGAFKMAANLLGLAVGVIAAAVLYNVFAGELAKKTGATAEFTQVIVFILIAILVPVVLGWLASMLTRFFQTIHLNILNRLAGAVIGAIGYGMVMSFAFNIMDLNKSKGGNEPELLEQRSDLYYKCKHAAQPIIPDVLIVTDSTEMAMGETPKYGLRDEIPSILQHQMGL